MSLRPTTLKEIAERSDSIGDFGRHLRDWLHELRRASSRTEAAATIADEPPLELLRLSPREQTEFNLGPE